MKTTAFHRHIFNPLDRDRVCVDRHVIKYFNFGENVCITPKRYTTYSNAIKVWSEKINMYPSELQALVWLYAKKKYGINI
jgi:thermostable 8-oxoguanine DNA glycosylase